MKALVTGGDGFVGQHLLAHLLEAGVELTATTVNPVPAFGTLDDAERAAVSWSVVDVRDTEALARTVNRTRPDRVFHLAGYSSRAEVSAAAQEALLVNAGGTLNLVEALAAAGLPGTPLVVSGSADAYGRGTSGPIAEQTPLRPETSYGATKAAQEVVARGAGQELDVDVRVARLFPLLGPGQREAFVLPGFCRRAARIARGDGDPRLHVGSLDVERDFTDVRDGVRGIAMLAGIDVPTYRTYNICSGQGTSIRQLLEWVLAAAGVNPEVVIDPRLVRANEPARVVGDPARLREATEWGVERDLRGAVDDTFRWTVQPAPR